jgi:hypothetical protein
VRLPTLQELVVIGLMTGAAMAVIVFVCAMIDYERTARALGVVKIALTSFMKPFRRQRDRDRRATSAHDELSHTTHRPAVKAPPTISDFVKPPGAERRDRTHRDG